MTDFLLAAWMSGIIEACRLWSDRMPVHARGPSEKLRLLFVGYNGTRNTGSDVRVEEMLRQTRHLFGESRVELQVFSYDQDNSRGYFDGARQITPPVLFPPFLHREIPRHHGVVACEGSTFKSKFTDLLTVMMVGALGVAAAHGMPGVAYGAEAGAMNPMTRWMTSRYCREALILTRNASSRQLLATLGVPSALGTDTAWTFEPLGHDYAEGVLRAHGWSGEAILAVCPINPFWWPVKASLLKGVARLFGAYKSSHYARIFFFRSGWEVRRSFERYLNALARAVNHFRHRHRAFPIVVASEQLDNPATRELADKLGGTATFSSTDYDMYQLVSILRCARWMISSRYHAIVTTMVGGVASAGISMDERIVNLMSDRGHAELLLRTDEVQLEEKLVHALERLHGDAERIAADCRAYVATQLPLLASMGKQFLEHMVARYPWAAPDRVFKEWLDYLPPLSRELSSILESCPAP